VIEMTDDRRNPLTSSPWAFLLATAGFLVTPFTVYILGHILLAGRPGFSEQGMGLGLFFFGGLAAIPGALYCWILGFGIEQAERRKRSVASAWALAVMAYGAFILAVILVTWRSFSRAIGLGG
jgi:hypothetical protein